MTKPAEPESTVGKRSRTPTTRAVTGRPSTVRAMSPPGPADAAVCGSTSTGTGCVSVGCAGRSTPGSPMEEKATTATVSPTVGAAVVAAPTPRQAPSGTDTGGPLAGWTSSGPSETRAVA